MTKEEALQILKNNFHRTRTTNTVPVDAEALATILYPDHTYKPFEYTNYRLKGDKSDK